MGQGVVWYTGQFYAQTFLETTCRLDFEQTRTILIWAIVFATPLFVFFGQLSDRVGRKWIMLAGMFLAVVTYRPIYRQILSVTDTSRASVIPDRTTVTHNLAPVQGKTFSIRTTTTDRIYDNGITERQTSRDTVYRTAVQDTKATGKSAGTLRKIVPKDAYWQLIILVFIQILYVTMVYGPIAAFLVELFPTRIRYTSMSLPYHIGNGVFGGLTPFIALLLGTMYTGDPLVGLWYPIGVALVCLVIGTLYVSNRIDPNVND
jgi:MFS family permease